MSLTPCYFIWSNKWCLLGQWAWIFAVLHGNESDSLLSHMASGLSCTVSHGNESDWELSHMAQGLSWRCLTWQLLWLDTDSNGSDLVLPQTVMILVMHWLTKQWVLLVMISHGNVSDCALSPMALCLTWHCLTWQWVWLTTVSHDNASDLVRSQMAMSWTHCCSTWRWIWLGTASHSNESDWSGNSVFDLVLSHLATCLTVEDCIVLWAKMRRGNGWKQSHLGCAAHIRFKANISEYEANIYSLRSE